jgi:hypothetical protein
MSTRNNHAQYVLVRELVMIATEVAGESAPS